MIKIKKKNIWSLKSLSNTIENLNLLLLLFVSTYFPDFTFVPCNMKFTLQADISRYQKLISFSISRSNSPSLLSFSLSLSLFSFSRIFKPLYIQPTEKDTIRFSKLWKDSLNNGIVPSREQVNFVIAWEGSDVKITISMRVPMP